MGRHVEVAVVTSDDHFPHQHKPTWAAKKLWIRRRRPDVIFWLGDFLDLDPLSRFAKEAGNNIAVLPALVEWIAEVTELSNYCGRQCVLEGNHEARYGKILENYARELHGLVGLTLEEQCRAQGLPSNVEWGKANADKPLGYKFGDVSLVHGHEGASRFGGGKHLAHNILVGNHHESILVGHHHALQMFAMGTNSGRGVVFGIANGHGENKVNYSPRNSWVRGMTVLERNTATDRVTPYPIIIDDGRFCYGGELFDGNEDAITTTPRRPNKIEWEGKSYSAEALAKMHGMPGSTLRSRLALGWSVERAVKEPASRHGVLNKEPPLEDVETLVGASDFVECDIEDLSDPLLRQVH